jgi:hypothetical protein
MAIFHSYVWHNQRITIGYKNRNVPMAHHLLRILHLVWYPCAIQMGRHGVQDCHMSISKNIQMITFDYMTAYDHTWLYMIIYYMTIYDYIWLYMIICTSMYSNLEKNRQECPGWHRWSFPIFSRFPTCLSFWAFLCMYLSSDVDHLLSHWCQLFSYLAMRHHETATFGPEKKATCLRSSGSNMLNK